MCTGPTFVKSCDQQLSYTPSVFTKTTGHCIAKMLFVYMPSPRWTVLASFVLTGFSSHYRSIGLVINVQSTAARYRTTNAKYSKRAAHHLETGSNPHRNVSNAQHTIISDHIEMFEIRSTPHQNIATVQHNPPGGGSLTILCVLGMCRPQGYVFHNFCLARVCFDPSLILKFWQGL